MVQQIECILKAQIEQLEKRWPGALVPDEPKIVWIKMYDHLIANPLLAAHRKFNNALNNCLALRKHSYVIKMENVFAPKEFNNFGQLTAAGRMTFWRHVDKQIELFDKHKAEHLPVHKDNQFRGTKSFAPFFQFKKNTSNYKLPPLPVERSKSHHMHWHSRY